MANQHLWLHWKRENQTSLFSELKKRRGCRLTRGSYIKLGKERSAKVRIWEHPAAVNARKYTASDQKSKLEVARESDGEKLSTKSQQRNVFSTSNKSTETRNPDERKYSSTTHNNLQCMTTVQQGTGVEISSTSTEQ